MKKYLVGILLLFIHLSYTEAQIQPPFYDEIQAFKKQDSLQPPPRHAILFVGSSSFRFWTNVQDYFPGYTIINRGFGGSTLPDVIRYANDIIFPYQPKQIVIYCGENDFAASDTVSVSLVTQTFQQLFFLIRKQLPTVPIVFVSIKPSPSRRSLMPKFEEANKQIQTFLQTQPHTAFVNVYNAMLNEQGQPIPALFREDSLHMKPQGYEIWQKKLQPYLIK